MDLGLAGRGATELRGSIPDRRAVAHSGLFSQASSLSPYPLTWWRGSGTRRRQQGVELPPILGIACAGGDGAGGWTSGWRGEGPPSYGGRFPDRRAVAHSGLIIVLFLQALLRGITLRPLRSIDGQGVMVILPFIWGCRPQK